jgi:hypothetical protein
MAEAVLHLHRHCSRDATSPIEKANAEGKVPSRRRKTGGGELHRPSHAMRGQRWEGSSGSRRGEGGRRFNDWGRAPRWRKRALAAVLEEEVCTRAVSPPPRWRRKRAHVAAAARAPRPLARSAVTRSPPPTRSASSSLTSAPPTSSLTSATPRHCLLLPRLQLHINRDRGAVCPRCSPAEEEHGRGHAPGGASLAAPAGPTGHSTSRQ